MRRASSSMQPQQRRGLPPTPSSLLAPPHISQTITSHAIQHSTMPVPNHGALTAQAVTAALSNPYAQTYSSGYHSSHYAQAYMQYSANGSSWPSTNADGYTLSTTYVQGSIPQAGRSSAPILNRPTNHSSQYSDKSNRGTHNRAPQQMHMPSSNGSWYQFGNARCTYKSCTFTGSQKALEIHMMDRHLIYPPGWEKRKTGSDWDADPSLKGKPIPIQGTTIVLDDPEVLDAWIAERKKRWPSANRVEEKKRKREEAVARGQISVDDPALLRGKRPRHDKGPQNAGSQQRENRSERARGRGRGRGRGTDGGWRGRGRGSSNLNTRDGPESSQSTPVALPMSNQTISPTQDPDASSISDDDGPPEVITSKPPPALVGRVSSTDDEAHDEAFGGENTPTSKAEIAPASAVPNSSSQTVKPVKKPRSNQPKKAPYNPFASRPTLLRNLLLPEIRVTVSNLSQAIRFLVDNDFLQGVEMKAGEADEKLIEVIGDSDASPPTAENVDSALEMVQ